jgi:AAA+ superfamily predicted ATPase
MVNNTEIEQKIRTKAGLNAAVLIKEFEWFTKVVNTRFDLHFDKETECKSIYQHSPPNISEDISPYSSFIQHYQLLFEERIILLLTIIPHVAPQLLDVFFVKNNHLERGYTEFGGIKGISHGGFLPTMETAFFILAGNNIEKRLELKKIFRHEHFFYAHNILQIEKLSSNEPEQSCQILLTDDYVDYFTTGEARKPRFEADFPAKLITTQYEWDDLVVEEYTIRQIEEIKAWLLHGEKLLRDWGMSRKLKPGYKILFFGPPGTGKTLTACLFGKLAEKDVFRIDLSMVVSKYIGETAKNLEKVFRKAENKNWILFFDEADALFGKRTQISDAHDKYANQEISYLLQRLEDYNGLVILASNLKSNIDEAFCRRLQAMISFPMPKPRERLRLWKQSFSEKSTFEDSIDLNFIAERYALSGGSIMNVVRYSSLMAINRNENIIRKQDILEGIKREFEKEGKTI